MEHPGLKKMLIWGNFFLSLKNGIPQTGCCCRNYKQKYVSVATEFDFFLHKFFNRFSLFFLILLYRIAEYINSLA